MPWGGFEGEGPQNRLEYVHNYPPIIMTEKNPMPAEVYL